MQTWLRKWVNRSVVCQTRIFHQFGYLCLKSDSPVNLFNANQLQTTTSLRARLKCVRAASSPKTSKWCPLHSIHRKSRIIFLFLSWFIIQPASSGTRSNRLTWPEILLCIRLNIWTLNCSTGKLISSLFHYNWRSFCHVFCPISCCNFLRFAEQQMCLCDFDLNVRSAFTAPRWFRPRIMVGLDSYEVELKSITHRWGTREKSDKNS